MYTLTADRTLRACRQWGAAAYDVCGVPADNLNVATVDGTPNGLPPEGTPQFLLDAGGLVHGGTGSGEAPSTASRLAGQALALLPGALGSVLTVVDCIACRASTVAQTTPAVIVQSGAIAQCRHAECSTRLQATTCLRMPWPMSARRT